MPNAPNANPGAGPALGTPAGVPARLGGINNSAFCDPYTSSFSIGAAGLNATILTTPANGSGPAPLNFSWSIRVNGGGLPPYASEVRIVFGTQTVIDATLASGNVTLATAGTYAVDVFVEDASCTQTAGLALAVQAWGPLGPHPISVAASATYGPAPLNETYTASVAPGAPSNWTVAWQGPGLYPYAPVENYTYFFPGTYRVTACLVEPNFADYACADSDNVTVVGAPPVSVATPPATGSYPWNVTFWVNLTPPSLLPVNGTDLHVVAWTGTTGIGNDSVNGSVELNATGVGCGPGYPLPLDPSGNCTLELFIDLYGNTTSEIDHGIFLGMVYAFPLASHAAVGTFVPTGVGTFAPLNGSAPLNLSINLSMTGGVAPYFYAYAVVGHTSGPNGTFLPTQAGIAAGWNGTAVHLVVPLNASGYYFAVAELQDQQGRFVTFAAPLIVVGTNVSIPAPLRLSVTTTALLAASSRGGTIGFEVGVTGGRGPVTIEWAFGDGTFGSSVPGAFVNHTYTASGTYRPDLTVSDATGTVAQAIPEIVVELPSPDLGRNLSPAPAPSTGQGSMTFGAPPSLGSTAGTALGAEVAAAIALMSLAGLWHRGEMRRQGERLVDVRRRGASSRDDARVRRGP